MKIVRRDFVPNGPGSVKMIPDESDDLWLAYNLIAPGDTVMAVTIRKVLREAASGSREAERVKLKLEIKVENVDYDKEGAVLRIRGKNILENEHVKIGQFHTLEIELHRPFVLRKVLWDSLTIDALQQAADPSASADLAVVLMQEGLAHILLVGKSVTITRSRIEASIPRKHGPSVAGYDKALNKFYENVLQAFVKHIDFKVVRCAVIASPGFTKDQFHRHLMLEAERRNLRDIIENKSRIILVHSTSGYKHSLREVLDAPNVMNIIKDTKAAQEVRVLKDFFTMLTNDPHRACYGPKHVEVAHERMAVQTLLITDDLFRSSDVATRQKYVNFVNTVKDSGGTAHIFSSMHVSGEQLAQLTGIAAILRFPLPDLDDIEITTHNLQTTNHRNQTTFYHQHTIKQRLHLHYCRPSFLSKTPQTNVGFITRCLKSVPPSVSFSFVIVAPLKQRPKAFYKKILNTNILPPSPSEELPVVSNIFQKTSTRSCFLFFSRYVSFVSICIQTPVQATLLTAVTAPHQPTLSPSKSIDDLSHCHFFRLVTFGTVCPIPEYAEKMKSTGKREEEVGVFFCVWGCFSYIIGKIVYLVKNSTLGLDSPTCFVWPTFVRFHTTTSLLKISILIKLERTKVHKVSSVANPRYGLANRARQYCEFCRPNS
ncbi:unnamed protein product [Lactuca virosa]|uniref:eRF1/Pelota-like N-terminal domain-containing protein n=1 Tax=Lactuca virosa TaxID=75947 RepID=A0AAU9MQF4_9ASTR|nr:unnamed protein product [Lactuca virosa]